MKRGETGKVWKTFLNKYLRNVIFLFRQFKKRCTNCSSLGTSCASVTVFFFSLFVFLRVAIWKKKKKQFAELNSDWLASNILTLAWGGFCSVWSNSSQHDGNGFAERVPRLQRSHRRDSWLVVKVGAAASCRRVWMTLNITSSWRGRGTINWPGNLTPPSLLLFVCLFGFLSPGNDTGVMTRDAAQLMKTHLIHTFFYQLVHSFPLIRFQFSERQSWMWPSSLWEYICFLLLLFFRGPNESISVLSSCVKNNTFGKKKKQRGRSGVTACRKEVTVCAAI